MAHPFAPFYPIIYVRGYAMTASEVADTESLDHAPREERQQRKERKSRKGTACFLLHFVIFAFFVVAFPDAHKQRADVLLHSLWPFKGSPCLTVKALG